MGAPESWDRVELTVPSVLDYLSLVNAVSEEFGLQMGADEDTRNAINSSVVEACTNAMEHGNGLDREKRVILTLRAAPGRFEIDVSDEGEGFDPEEVQDPRKPENLLRERGRGIFILRNFMDEVRFRIEPSRGTTVHMVKELK